MYKLSVVIPIYNQIYPLSLNLWGFTKQSLSIRDFELIIVNDGSTEPVEAVVEAYRNTLNITYVSIRKSGRATARNIGMKYAKGRVIVFCDADRVPSKNFLSAHLNAHYKEKNSVVIGHVKDIYANTERLEKEEIKKLIDNERFCRTPQYSRLVYQLYSTAGEPLYPVPWISTFSGNMSIYHQDINSVELFDENFSHWGFEHFELGLRLYEAGYKFSLEKNATNIHLAHSRDVNSYKKHLSESHKYFFKKHPRFSVYKLLDFMMGKISLYQFIESATESVDIDVDFYNQYVKITNF